MPRSLLHSWLWAPPLAALGRSGLHPLGSVLPQQIRTVRRCTLPMCPWTHASVPLHNRHANAGAGQPPLSAVHAQRVSALSGRVCTHCALAHREQLPHYILFPQTFATLDAFCLPPLGRVAHMAALAAAKGALCYLLQQGHSPSKRLFGAENCPARYQQMVLCATCAAVPHALARQTPP